MAGVTSETLTRVSQARVFVFLPGGSGKVACLRAWFHQRSAFLHAGRSRQHFLERGTPHYVRFLSNFVMLSFVARPVKEKRTGHI